MDERKKSNIVKIGCYKYDTAQELGKGAFGTVFKAWQIESEQAVKAVKIMDTELVNRDDLQREIKIMKKLTRMNHKNIVQLYDCIIRWDKVFLVMEFCWGGNLAEYLETFNGRPLPEETIQQFANQLGSGISALHSENIIHRDLKPQNILVHSTIPCPKFKTKPGRRYPSSELIILKIADFGIARFLSIKSVVDVLKGNSDKTKKTVCGTPIYMAPEVWSGIYNEKADVWSLGLVMYECLAGSSAVREKNLQLKFSRSTSFELRDLLTRSLRRNPQERLSLFSFMRHRFLRPHSTLHYSSCPVS